MVIIGTLLLCARVHCTVLQCSVHVHVLRVCVAVRGQNMELASGNTPPHQICTLAWQPHYRCESKLSDILIPFFFFFTTHEQALPKSFPVSVYRHSPIASNAPKAGHRGTWQSWA